MLSHKINSRDAKLIFSSHEPTFTFLVVPVCQHGQTKVFGVARQETARIPCELEANPPEVSFTWKFNNTMEAVDIPQAHVTSDRTRSTASYTPMTELDYGTLLCWGSNDQGTQLEPCVYHIVPAGKCSTSLQSFWKIASNLTHIRLSYYPCKARIPLFAL